jgi:hypothetical protein
MTPFIIGMWGTFAGNINHFNIVQDWKYLLTALPVASMYMMGRQVLGHKTWFGKA